MPWPNSPMHDVGLRVVQPASYIVFYDPNGNTYHAVTGGTDGQLGTDIASTDAATVIQNAINAIQSAGGEIIIKGPDVFSMSKKIVVNASHIHFRGVGFPSLQLANSVNDVICRIGDNVTPRTDVTFDSIDFDGNYLNNPSTTPPALLDFEGPPNDVNVNPMTDMLVSNCSIHDGQVRGVYYFCTAHSNILSSKFYNNGFAIDNNSSFHNFAIEAQGNIMAFNDIHNHRQDGLISSLCTECIYAHNDCHDNTGYGISLDSAFQLICEGNSSYRNGTAGNGKGGILNFSSISLGGLYNQITNNQVYANAGHGIQLNTQAKYTILANNMCRGNSQGGGGIYNEIYSNGHYSIVSGNICISDTTIKAKYGIGQDTSATFEVFENNMILGNPTTAPYNILDAGSKRSGTMTDFVGNYTNSTAIRQSANGNGVTITPLITGKVLLTLSASSVWNNSAGRAMIADIYRTTSSIPSQGQTATGTQVVEVNSPTSTNASELQSLNVSFLDIGLTLGTTYSYYPAFSNDGGGTATFRNFVLTCTEQTSM